jgi:hypothetical protein
MMSHAQKSKRTVAFATNGLLEKSKENDRTGFFEGS